MPTNQEIMDSYDAVVQEMGKTTDSIESHARTWEAFKEANNKKVGRCEETVERINERLDMFETASKRGRSIDPGPDFESRNYGPEAKAYFDYLRYGTKDESLIRAVSHNAEERKVLTVGDDTAAGYLAPPEYAREIIKAEIEFSPMRTVARVRPTARRAIQIPKRTGTFGAVWTAEQGTRSETTGLTYGLEEIPTHELYALVDISEQMLEDSEFNLETELQQEFSEQFAVTEGLAFVNGTAVTQPEGFLVNSDVGSTNSGSASLIEDGDGQANGLIDLYHALKTAYAVQGTWLLNRTTLGAVRKLKDANNNYIWMPGLASGIPNTILGQPYVEVPDMPTIAAGNFPIAFGNWQRGYTIVDRIVLSVLRDPFTQATSGNIRFIARRRVGGQLVLPEAIRLLKVSA